MDDLAFNPDCFYYGMWYHGMQGGGNNQEVLLLAVAWRNMEDKRRGHIKLCMSFPSTDSPAQYDSREVIFDDEVQVEEQYEKIAEIVYREMRKYRRSPVVAGVLFEEKLPLVCYGGEIPDRVQQMNDDPWWLDSEHLDNLIDYEGE